MTDAGLAAAVQQPRRARAADRRHPTPSLDHSSAPFYDDRPATPFLLDSAWPTPDLRAHGFALMGHPPLMVRPPGIPLPAPPAELRIVRVDDDRDRRRLRAHAHRRLSRAACCSRSNEVHARSRRRPSTRPGWHHFVGYVDDRPGRGGLGVRRRPARCASTTSPRSTRCAAAATALAITAATIAADPSKPATLIASDLGRPIYERLGFVAMSALHLLARHCAEPRSGHTPNFAARTIATASSGRRRR